MTADRLDLPQGTLELLILRTLALEPQHGWAISERIRQVSSDVLHVRQGSLYPALHRLERRKLLVAKWKPSDTGRDARFYRLTPKGRARLQEQTESWARLAEAVGLILGTAGGGAR
jgi:transcriptional regulator